MNGRIYFRPKNQHILEALEAHQRSNFLPSQNDALNHALSCFFFGQNPPPSPAVAVGKPQSPHAPQPPSMSFSSFEPEGWD
jgi:hypothetical protein